MTLFTTRPRSLEWAALAIILVLAAILRLGMPGTVEFWRDEANLSDDALNLAHGRKLPLLGQDSSVGIPFGPASVYLLAIPFVFNSDPMFATLFIGILNISAVLIVYVLTRRYYGLLAAILTGFVFAISPWAVFYSRRIWHPDMLPIFTVSIIATGVIGFIEGKRWAQLLHLPMLAIIGQIHYSTFVLVPVTLYLLWVGRRKLTRFFAFSVVFAGLLTVPYAVGIAQQGLLSPASVGKILASGVASSGDKHAVTFSDAVVRDAIFLIAGTDTQQLVGPDNALDYLSAISSATVYPLLRLLAWAVIASALWLAIRAIRCHDDRAKVDVALLIWLLCTPIIFSITWTRLNFYYLNLILPAAFMILGVGAHDLHAGLSSSPRVRRVVFAVGGLALGVILALQISTLAFLGNYINTHNTHDGNSAALNDFLVGFTTPLSYFETIRMAVLAQHPQAVLANLDGQFIGYHQDTTRWNVLLYGVPSVRFLDANTEVYPAQEAIYLSENCTAKTLNFHLRDGEPCYAVSARGPNDLDLSGFTHINDQKLTFANGARIIAYRWQPDSACLTFAWTINGPVPIKDDYTFSVHFMNAAGEEIINADDLSWRGLYWHDGDTVVKHVCVKNGLERKAQITGVHLGMYLYADTAQGPQFYNQDLYGPNGKAGQSIVIVFP